MEKEIFNQNFDTGDSTENMAKERFGTKEHSSQGGNCDAPNTIVDKKDNTAGVDNFVSEENVRQGESLGEYTDKEIAEGVVSSGLYEHNLKNSTKDTESKPVDNVRKELNCQDIFQQYDDEKQEEGAFLVSADEFDEMTNVIDGVQRKPRKKKKRKTKVRKIVVKTYATVICAVLCIVGIYFGVTFFQTAPTQGMDGADLKVDMTDLPHYVGTEGEVDLTKMFPLGSGFKKNGTNISNGVLKINSLDSFELTYNHTENEKETQITRQVEVVENAINVSDWEALSKAISAEQVVCIQSAYLAAPEIAGQRATKVSGFNLKNDLYGNGCKLNVFELVCCRGKNSGGKLSAPYLQGKGAVSGYSAFMVNTKSDGSQVLMQDLHIIGNDMITEEGGNMAGVSETIIEKRGLKLFSGYGFLIGVQGDTSVDESGQKGEKANLKLKHCILENSHKLIHVRHGNLDIEGNIIRNASDTTLSVATHANERSVITSRNNVIANSLTGGIVFYCYDSAISAANAEDSWNELLIEKGTFLDIYNWKPQDGLAFMPETESGAEVANPVAKSEIPKKEYDGLKAEVEGVKYIHFAIIKLRTGGGLPINGSYVTNYGDIGYKTTSDMGYPNGFPLPSVAAAIIKDIDVWGYYNQSEKDVTPTATLDPESVERLYQELKTGRTK